MAKIREATSMLLHSAEDGCVTWEMIARAALGYMSEDDVKGMCEANDFPCPWQDDEEEFEHDDDPEDDEDDLWQDEEEGFVPVTIDELGKYGRPIRKADNKDGDYRPGHLAFEDRDGEPENDQQSHPWTDPQNSNLQENN